MTLNIPTLLTFFRILLIPVMVLCFYWQHPWSNIFTTGTLSGTFTFLDTNLPSARHFYRSLQVP